MEGDHTLSWAGNNSAKLGSSENGAQCWTLTSTPDYGKRNKVPQENIPNAKAVQVRLLLTSVCMRCCVGFLLVLC